MSLIETQVYCEEYGTTYSLMLTPEQHHRATTDNSYLAELISQHRAELSEQNSPQQNSENPPNQETEDSGENSSSFIWTNSAVLLLLSLYEEHEEDFSIRRHKKVWEDIANKMKSTNAALTVTGVQCQTKLNGLKRTYKKILDHNNTSGNNRDSWPFFERMHEIFGSTRWAQPLAVASENGPFPSSSAVTETVNNSSSELSEQTNQARKRKLSDVLEKYLLEIKKSHLEKRKEREDRFKKTMELKEKHHDEKMMLLRELINRRS